MTSVSSLVLVGFAGFVLVGCASASKPKPTAQGEASSDIFTDFLSGGRINAADVGVVAKKAEKYPLGSKENPVRVNMPQGQKAYLVRLNCPDGTKGQFKRAGSFGAGPYRSIIDGYEMTCSGQAQDELIYMDMYHPDHREDEPVPGYTID